MGALFGPVGELWEMPCAASLRESSGGRGTGHRMLSGVVRFQWGPQPRRAWDVDVATATPEEAVVLAHRARRRGDVSRPFWFFSEEAQTANMLPPQVSMLEDGHRVGGSLVAQSSTFFATTDDYRPLSAVVCTTGGTIVTVGPDWAGMTVALPHDRDFSASVFAAPWEGGTATLRVAELDQAGQVITTHYATQTGQSALQRISVSRRSDLRTVALRMSVHNALAVADPAVTLTSGVLPYAVGAGCARAALVSAAHDVQRATTALWDRRSAHSYSIQELG